MTIANDVLMKWLRVQMLRLRSFDWEQGSWTTDWLKDGVAKFSSRYSLSKLIDQLDVSEGDILTFFDSTSASEEMAAKSFTASWREGQFTLSWLEEGVRDTRDKTSLNYFEKDGSHFVTSSWIFEIVYLDGTVRTVEKNDPKEPTPITEEKFLAMKRQLESQ